MISLKSMSSPKIMNLQLTKPLPAALSNSRKKREIILVAGHHSWDTGATGSFGDEVFSEHEEMKKIVLKVEKILIRDGFIPKVVPFNLRLAKKIKWINKNCDSNSLLFSFHMNASKYYFVRGVETWYKSNSERSKKIAELVQKALVNLLPLKDRGIKGDFQNRHGQLGILRETKMQDKCLLELGFISHVSSFEKDIDIIREKGAEAAAEGIKNAYHNC